VERRKKRGEIDYVPHGTDYAGRGRPKSILSHIKK